VLCLCVSRPLPSSQTSDSYAERRRSLNTLQQQHTSGHSFQQVCECVCACFHVVCKLLMMMMMMMLMMPSTGAVVCVLCKKDVSCMSCAGDMLADECCSRTAGVVVVVNSLLLRATCAMHSNGRFHHHHTHMRLCTCLCNAAIYSHAVQAGCHSSHCCCSDESTLHRAHGTAQ
jgi:hypothetical protein